MKTMSPMNPASEPHTAVQEPRHPGEVLRGSWLKPLGLSVTQTARALGVSRKTLSCILNGRSGISPEMAVRLSIAFDTPAENWLRHQLQFDLVQAEQKRSALQVRRLAVV